MSTATKTAADPPPAKAIPPKRPRATTPGPRPGSALIGFTLPAALWYGLFTIGPVVAMIYIATLRWPGLLADSVQVGPQNFLDIRGDQLFWLAVRNTAVHLLVTLPVMIPLAFMLGYYLSLKPRGHRILSVLFFTPGLISITVKGMVFFAMFAPNGAINGLLGTVGLASLQMSWTANPSTALYTVIAVDLWSGIGWTAVLFAARLTAIPSEVYEAASLDGAGHLRKIVAIARPMSTDFIGVMTMLQFLWTLFNSAAIVLLLTGGGPAGRSTTLSYYVYERAFIAQQVGYSQAVAIALFAIGLAGMVGIRRTIRQDW